MSYLTTYIYEFRWGWQAVTTFAACVEYNNKKEPKTIQTIFSIGNSQNDFSCVSVDRLLESESS